MGVWIELRCENRDSADVTGTWNGTRYERCLSHDNDGPMGEASETNAKVVRLLSNLGKEALASGWKKTRAGWICPYCVQAMKTPNV